MSEKQKYSRFKSNTNYHQSAHRALSNGTLAHVLSDCLLCALVKCPNISQLYNTDYSYTWSSYRFQFYIYVLWQPLCYEQVFHIHSHSIVHDEIIKTVTVYIFVVQDLRDLPYYGFL